MSPTAITLTDRLQLLNFYAKKIRERKGKKREGWKQKGRERKSRGEGKKETERRRGKDLIHVSFCGCPWIEPTSASATDGNGEWEGGGEAIGHLHKNRGPCLLRRCSFTPMAVRLFQIIPSHSRWSTGIGSLPRSIQSREKFPLKHQPNGLLSHYISETALHVFLHSLCD